MFYHGTRSNFDEFILQDRLLYGRALGDGFYFTPNYQKAHKFANGLFSKGEDRGGIVMPVYLQMKNPYVIELDADITKWHNEYNKGDYDGIIDLKNQTWYVENSTQIKSATDNIGTFDKTDPNIKHSIKDTSSIESREAIVRTFGELATTDGEIQKINDKITKTDESLLKIATTEPFRNMVRKYKTEPYKNGYCREVAVSHSEIFCSFHLDKSPSLWYNGPEGFVDLTVCLAFLLDRSDVAILSAATPSFIFIYFYIHIIKNIVTISCFNKSLLSFMLSFREYQLAKQLAQSLPLRFADICDFPFQNNLFHYVLLLRFRYAPFFSFLSCLISLGCVRLRFGSEFALPPRPRLVYWGPIVAK